MRQLDEIDAEILRSMLRESRTTFTEIAKNCRISVCAVRSRYNRLKRTGIVWSEEAHINPRFWGYECVADLIVETRANSVEEVEEFLDTKAYVLKYRSFGIRTLEGFMVLSKIEELGGIIEELESHPKIRKAEILLWDKNQNIDYVENLIIKPIPSFSKSNDGTPPSKVGARVQIDATDRQMIKLLLHKSRVPFSLIAKKLGLSTNSVIQRYRRLKAAGVVTHSTITVDLEKIGYNAYYQVYIKLANRSFISGVCEKLLTIPNAIRLIRHIGKYDLRVEFPVTSIGDILYIDNEIQKIDNVERIHTHTLKLTPWPRNLYAKLV
ncbi:MAG: Lrp/AsnC family transcriptional regulator [Candidatus Bathyarchaeia archaeon]